MIRIYGDTGNGKASCGHKIKAGEHYFLQETKRGIFSVCKHCVSGRVQVEKEIKVPQDLVDNLIEV
jgi:hypothetical protein